MTAGLFKVTAGGDARWAVGSVDGGPTWFLPREATLDSMLAAGVDSLEAMCEHGTAEMVSQGAVLVAPIDRQPVWAAGVTYPRSRDARLEESGGADFYDRVYDAERPELFFKALPENVRGPGQKVAIRADSTWNVPEPELALVADRMGRLVGITLGNDVSSRSIEGENPLYLPQAKIFDGSCALGPCIVPVQPETDLGALTIRMTITRAADLMFSDEVPVSAMRRNPGELLRWLFRALTFPFGAVLLTGTSTVPPVELTLEPDDEVVIACDEIGRLGNTVELLRERVAT